MSWDGFFLNALISELHRDFAESRVAKVHQPDTYKLTLLLGETKKKQRLVLSIDPRFPGLFVTTEQFENPESPPHFCLMLRKFIEGSRLLSIRMEDFERVVTLSFLGRDDLGEQKTYHLSLELTGRHSNLILHANGIILDAVKRIPWGKAVLRPILPGLRYETPPSQGKVSPLTLQAETILAAIPTSDSTVPQLMCSIVNGLSMPLATAIARDLSLASSTAADLTLEEWQRLAQVVRALACRCQSGEVQQGYLYRGEKTHFHIHPLTQLTVPSETVLGINNLVVKALLAIGHDDPPRVLCLKLTKEVQLHLTKLRRREEALEKDLVKSREREPFKLFGQLLYANVADCRKAGNTATVVDYYNPDLPEVLVPIDPKLSIVDNAKQYFKRYTRAEGTEKHSLLRLAQCQQEIDYFASLLSALALAEDLPTLQEIARELQDIDVLPQTRGKAKQPALSRGPLKFVAPDGSTILVGRNNLQNDAMVKAAGPKDLWLHVQKAPGSHVIVTYSPALSDQTILFAAQLAAYYSSQRHSANVPVDFTERRHVKRPAGGRPGFVHYENQRTVIVRTPTLPETNSEV
ncbi:MAG: NFACT family protein [Thermaerobacter sp.]|nr:NFACT family protein [Thermaerobacter sp.]